MRSLIQQFADALPAATLALVAVTSCLVATFVRETNTRAPFVVVFSLVLAVGSVAVLAALNVAMFAGMLR